MIISILTGGSRGDVQPYIALGTGLKKRGYEVHLIASDDFEGLVKDAGLTFCSTGISVEAIIQTDEWRAITERGNFFVIAKKMREETKRQAQEMAKRLPDLLAGSDVMIAGVGGLGGGFSIAEKLGIPIIQAYLFPLTPTREFPAPLVSNLPFGNILNPLSFHVMRQVLWQSTRAGDVEVRRLLNMSGTSFWSPFAKLKKQQVPVLYGYSQYVIPKPSDWDNNHYVTGYWFLNEASDWQPPADFVDFLDAGTPPVYVGFGSMLNKNPQEVLSIVLDSLKASGQRGVLASGWGGMTPSDLPDDVYMISSMPHSWLFPKMAAVVHHGGAGTTAAGLRAGVPSIIVPFMGDQGFWGHQIHKLGVGAKPIPRKQLSVNHLAEAIQQVISNRQLQNKAQQLGQQIENENGVKQASEIVQRLIESRQPQVFPT